MASEISSRRIRIVLSLSIFCAMLGIGIIAPILPLYAKSLGASSLAIGLIISAFSFARAGGMVASGELAERIDRKKLLMGGLFVYALASVAYAFATSTEILIFIRTWHGIGSAMVVPIAMAIAADIAPKGEEGSYFGTLQAALFLGVGFGPLLSGILADGIGLHAPFYAMTTLTLLSLFLVYRLLPFSDSSASEREEIGTLDAFKGLLSDHEMLIVFFFQFASAMCRGVLVMVIPIFASQLEISFSHIGIIVSLNSLSTGFLQNFSGKLADNVHKNTLIIIGGLISAVTLIGLPNLTSPLSLSVASIAFGVGHALASPSLAAIAATRGKSFGSGRTMGLFNIAFSIGMTVGPIMVGILMDVAGNGIPFYILSVFLAGSAIPFFSRNKQTACLK